MTESVLAFLRRDLRESLAVGAERDPANSAVGAAWLLYWALAAAVDQNTICVAFQNPP